MNSRNYDHSLRSQVTRVGKKHILRFTAAFNPKAAGATKAACSCFHKVENRHPHLPTRTSSYSCVSVRIATSIGNHTGLIGIQDTIIRTAILGFWNRILYNDVVFYLPIRPILGCTLPIVYAQKEHNHNHYTIVPALLGIELQYHQVLMTLDTVRPSKASYA